jgi:transcriptional regulator with XRE-family HTH domain
LAAPASPTVRRRRLAAELRRLRGARTGGTIAKALGWSPAKISRYELGQSNFPLDEVEKLLDFYGVTEPRRGQLLALAEDANQRGWWEDYADALTPEFMEFLGLETEATTASEWHLGVIPGLLQTEEYARQIYLGFQRAVPTPPGVIERRVQVRMARQQILTSRVPPLELAAVLDEAVILRKMGSSDLMYRQLNHLVEVADLPNVDLRILPLASGSTPINDSFVVYSFGAPQPPDGASMLHDVVWAESVKSQFYVEGETDTYNFGLVFEGLQEAALPSADSKRFILETAERMWRRPLCVCCQSEANVCFQVAVYDNRRTRAGNYSGR